ncbi:hypothetical protein ABW20_dc0109973 [Dactylellina cionopaga]|nr:hypothetical protein ABW20_dc0109973 [Dactylellina cionopaga]
MTRIAIIRARRLRGGKQTVFRYNGRDVDEKKIERFIRDNFKQPENMLLDDAPTPVGLTYATPGIMNLSSEAPTPVRLTYATPRTTNLSFEADELMLDEPMLDEIILHSPPPSLESVEEMPSVVVWALGAARPLQFDDLAMAWAIIDNKTPSEIHRGTISALSLGVLEIDQSDYIVQSTAAAGVLARLLPTSDFDNLILETILKGLTQERWIGSIFRNPLTHLRFQNEAFPDLLHKSLLGFVQYATLYWASHLSRIRDSLTAEAEAALGLLIKMPMCLTWIESLAIITGNDFHMSLSRILCLASNYCNGDKQCLKTETVKSLRRWISSCQGLLLDWTEVINRFPGEIHHIEPIFLPGDSCFRRQYNNSPQWALPACTLLAPKPLRTPFEALRDNICVFEESSNRMYVTKRERGFKSYISGSKAAPNWTIHCHSLDTGLEIAVCHGESRFTESNDSWRGTEYVFVQLALSNDSKYLAYEEHVSYDQSNAESRVFTYCWELKDIGSVDHDHFGTRIAINSGVPVCYSGDKVTTLRFCPDNSALLHAGGKFDIKNRTSIAWIQPFTQVDKLRSVHISSDGTKMHVTKSSKDAQSSSLEIWQCTDITMSMVFEYNFQNVLPGIMAISILGRFVAFTQRLPPKSLDEPQQSDWAYEDPRTHSFRVLDTKTGFEHELYAYRDDAWNAQNDHVTPLRPDKAFFGNTEAETTLFILRPTSGLRSPEGRIWRRSLGGWVNIGRIRFDWACRPLKFNNDDSCIVGIRREGVFSVAVEGLETIVQTIETGAVRQESEHSKSFWRDSSLYYVNSDMRNGTEFKIGGWLWKLGGQDSLSQDFTFASPVRLCALKDIWVPAPGNRVHFGIEGEKDGQCSSLISFEGAISEFTSDIQFHPIDGDIAAVAADGRYKVVAQLLPGGNEIGRIRMAKAVRLCVYSGSSIRRDNTDEGRDKVSLKVFDLIAGARRDYSWEEEVLGRWGSKVCSYDGRLLVLGFNVGTLLTVLELPFAGDELPRLKQLMSLPKSYLRLDKVQWYEVTQDNRLKVVIVEDDEGAPNSAGGPQSILTSFDISSGWENAGSIVNTKAVYRGPSIEGVWPSCALRQAPGNAPRSQTYRVNSKTEKWWRCQEWTLKDEHGKPLQERKYLWF